MTQPETSARSSPAARVGDRLRRLFTRDRAAVLVLLVLTVTGATRLYLIGTLVPAMNLILLVRARTSGARALLGLLLAFNLLVLTAAIVAWG